MGRAGAQEEGDVGHVRDTATYSSKTVRAWYIIDPRHSRAMQCWDLTTMLALLFTAIVTPVEVSFFLPPNSGWEALFLINRFVDVIFIIDLILQFFVMYPTTTYMEGARWVFDQREIVWHYLTFWFPIDLLVILVSAFDFVALAANVAAEELRSGVNCGADCAVDIAASESNIDLIRKLKVLRVLRILRLIKLLRLLRMSRIFNGGRRGLRSTTPRPRYSSASAPSSLSPIYLHARGHCSRTYSTTIGIRRGWASSASAGTSGTPSKRKAANGTCLRSTTMRRGSNTARASARGPLCFIRHPSIGQ